MFKKLLLLVVGGVAAAGGFFYYTSLAPEEAESLAQRLSEQKVNLEKIARDIADSEVVKKAIDKGTQALAETPAVKSWLNDTVKSYAQEQQGVSLSDAQASELVNSLMDLRSFSEVAAGGDSLDPSAFTAEQRQRLDEIMARGDQVFQEHLGVPMNQFLTSMSRSAMSRPATEGE
jgi:hypothetical protein